MQSIRLAAEKYAGGVGIATYKESLSAMDKRFDETAPVSATLKRSWLKALLEKPNRTVNCATFIHT